MAEGSSDSVHFISEKVELFCDPCRSDTKQTSACGFCENCDQFLCDSCIKQHKKFAALKSHTILDQSHMPLNRRENAKICSQVCGIHPQKKVKYFCKDHQNFICSVCMNLEHLTCKLEYIPVASKNFRNNKEYLDITEELETLIRTVRIKLSNTTTQIKHIKKVNAIEIGLMTDFLMEIQEVLTKNANILINSSVTINRNNTRVVETLTSLLNSVSSDLQEMRLALLRVEHNNSQLCMLTKAFDSQIRDKIKVVADIGFGHTLYDLRIINDGKYVNSFKTPTALGTMETQSACYLFSMNDKHHNFRLTSCINLGDVNCGVVFVWENSEPLFLNLDNRQVRTVVPTHLLIRPDGKSLEAFGYEAHDTYLELADGGTQNEWYFFKWFWQQISGDMTTSVSKMMKDETGKEIQAITVVSSVLKYLFIKLERKLSESGIAIPSSDIHLVLTLPGNWKEEARTFLTLALRKAEIDIGQLSMLTESEAVAIYFLHLNRSEIMASEKEKLSMPAPGTPFIVCIFKEAMLDMNLHKIKRNLNMRHLITEQEMAFGLSNIDRCFEKLINSLAGCEVMTTLKNEHYNSYMTFTEDFKMTFNHVKSSEGNVRIRIPMELCSCVKILTGKSLEEQERCTNTRLHYAIQEYALMQELYNPFLIHFSEMLFVG